MHSPVEYSDKMEPTEMRATALRLELKKRRLDHKGTKIMLISRLQFALDEERRHLFRRIFTN